MGALVEGCRRLRVACLLHITYYISFDRKNASRSSICSSENAVPIIDRLATPDTLLSAPSVGQAACCPSMAPTLDKAPSASSKRKRAVSEADLPLLPPRLCRHASASEKAARALIMKERRRLQMQLQEQMRAKRDRNDRTRSHDSERRATQRLLNEARSYPLPQITPRMFESLWSASPIAGMCPQAPWALKPTWREVLQRPLSESASYSREYDNETDERVVRVGGQVCYAEVRGNNDVFELRDELLIKMDTFAMASSTNLITDAGATMTSLMSCRTPQLALSRRQCAINSFSAVHGDCQHPKAVHHKGACAAAVCSHHLSCRSRVRHSCKVRHASTKAVLLVSCGSKLCTHRERHTQIVPRAMQVATCPQMSCCLIYNLIDLIDHQSFTITSLSLGHGSERGQTLLVAT